MSTRTLTVFARTGLSNRIYVLISGLALAAASGREFSMLWPRTPACGAAFHELFANDWPVEEVDAQAIEHWPYTWSRRIPIPPDLLAASAETVVIGAHQTLVRPDLYPAHAALVEPCLAYFRQLQPIAGIAAAVQAFRERHFRPAMIGVHLRRGDYGMIRPDMLDNTAAALAAVEEALRQLPQAGIFLATDDGAPDLRAEPTPVEGVRERFAQCFGERVVWTVPRSLARGAPEGVQDGLKDLWLLRQTGYFVGSAGSAFSRLAVYGRLVPHTFCRGSSPTYRRALGFCRLTGIYWLLRWLGRREFQRDLAFPALLRYYRSAPRRLLRSAFHRQPAATAAPEE